MPMFDIRPSNQPRSLDMRVEKRVVSKLVNPQGSNRIVGDVISTKRNNLVREQIEHAEDVFLKEDAVEVRNDFFQDDSIENILGNKKNDQISFKNSFTKEDARSKFEPISRKKFQADNDLVIKNKITSAGIVPEIYLPKEYRKILISFGSLAIIILILIVGINFLNKGLWIKDLVLGTGKDAYVDLNLAKEGMLARDFQKSSFEFNEAYDKFGKISQDLNSLGGILVESTRYIPFFSKLSSGSHLAKAGQDISRMGILTGEIMQSIDGIKNPLQANEQSVSFLKIFQDTDKNLKEISVLSKDLQENLEKVNVDDVPENRRAQFVEIKNKLPEINEFLDSFISNSQVFTDVLGGNGPRKYLFLFQNNQEMRATGSFIGTYGVLDIFNGNVRRFFIDGIFNPDGQLR